MDVAPSYLESGGDLLSRAVSSQVPSALKGLTSVFGMGTGGTPSPLPPEIVSFFRLDFQTLARHVILCLQSAACFPGLYSLPPGPACESSQLHILL